MKPSPSEPGPGESSQYQPPLPCRVSMFEPSPAAGLLHTCLLKEPILAPLGRLPSSPVPLHRLPNHYTGCRPCVWVQQCLGSSASLSVPGDGALSLSSHTSFLLFAWGGLIHKILDHSRDARSIPGLMVRLLEKPTFLFCSKRFAFYEEEPLHLNGASTFQCSLYLHRLQQLCLISCCFYL